MMPVFRIRLLCFTFLLAVVVVRSEANNITIALNKTLTQDNKELYGEFVTIDLNSTLSLVLTNPSKKLNYIIVQAHSHFYNITMYNNTMSRKSSVTGTNVGLYGTVLPLDKYYIINKYPINIKLYISVHGYTNNDPIPGGCNMEYPTPTAPYMHIDYTKDVVLVNAPAPKDPGDPNCIVRYSASEVIFYRMYLDKGDFDTDRYFSGLQKMITLDKIKEYGIEVPSTNTYMVQRRYLGAYPGTGSIHVAVAYIKSNPSSYAIYVPTYTYACSPLEGKGCNYDNDIVTQLFCAGFIVVGLFACSLGHRFFKTEMFMVGLFAGIIITYILLSIKTDLGSPALLGASLLTGLFFGGIWILLWWFYGIPILSVALATMHLGFIVSTIMYHCVPGNDFFSSDGRFWTIFVLLMVCCSLTLSTVSYLSNILACAILGAYAVIFGIDHYVGTHLKYLVYNTIRRATIHNFQYVVLAVPFRWQDILVSLLWVVLAVCGFVFQLYHNRGRSPFPPPPRSMTRLNPMTYGAVGGGRSRWFGVPNGLERPVTSVNERTPLLEDNE